MRGLTLDTVCHTCSRSLRSQTTHHMKSSHESSKKKVCNLLANFRVPLISSKRIEVSRSWHEGVLPAVSDTVLAQLFFLSHALDQSAILFHSAHAHPSVASIHLFLGGFIVAIGNDLSIADAPALPEDFSHDRVQAQQLRQAARTPQFNWVAQQEAQRRSGAPRGTTTRILHSFDEFVSWWWR